MDNNFQTSLQILKNTPNVLKALLLDINEEISKKNEGENTWSTVVIIAHLISNEYINFYSRIMLMVNSDVYPLLIPFDMEAQNEILEGKTINQLLDQFQAIRNKNIDNLLSVNFSITDFNKKAIHPQIGKVSITNIFSTWVAHGLSHIAQIARVLAKQYKSDVGSFIQFLRLLN